MDSLADCVLADAILIHPHPPLPPTTIKKVRALPKNTETSNRKNKTLDRAQDPRANGSWLSKQTA